MEFDYFRKVGEFKIIDEYDEYFIDELKEAFESSGLKLCRVESSLFTTTYIIMKEIES